MLELPTNAQQVKLRIKADIRSALPISNPFTSGSWLGTLSDAIGERIYSFYYAIVQLISELFPDTTTMYVQRWASIFNLSQKGAVGSTGTWNYTGSISITPGASKVPSGAILVDTNGNTYETTESTALSYRLLTSQAFIRASSGLTFTVTSTNHKLPNGAIVVFSSATNTDLNGSHAVTVIDANSFSVAVISSGSASGTATLAITSQETTIRSISAGVFN